jgi:hypothetical protein
MSGGQSAQSEALLQTKPSDLSGPSSRGAEGVIFPQPPRSKTPAIIYLGFQSIPEGREYALRVTDGVSSRLFHLLITHQAFLDHEARFQDGPDLCYGKLARDLDADPELAPSTARVELTVRELREYTTRERPTAVHKRRQPKP